MMRKILIVMGFSLGIIFIVVIVFCCWQKFLESSSKEVNSKFLSDQKINNGDFKKVEEIESKLNPTSLYEKDDYFYENFEIENTLFEAGSMNETQSPYWWLNSGGIFYSEGGTGKSVQGELPSDNFWRELYNKNNPWETDNGFHPQNIFRLVTRNKWKNFTQECYYKINKYILSADSHRAASNGLLLFNRYQDGDNLYYTGIRVDGTVVIKKKIKGVYFTMAQKPLYPGKYDRNKNPNLLPVGEWIGLRSEVSDEADGTVSIKVYQDKDRSGNWELVLSATDDGKKYGGAAIRTEGYAGIRTDFMDVEFDDYQVTALQ